ncbi:MAG: type IV pili twitching motility protein PilT, partial [Deltaproteobacteria bacterium]|nr:type IV pili twitching motility protein PilT [Deltaproteobacteria bacterium]
MELNDILGMAIKANASDIHLKVGLPPVYRIDGSLRPLPNAPRLTPEDIRKIAYAMMSEQQRERFERSNELDLAYG